MNDDDLVALLTFIPPLIQTVLYTRSLYPAAAFSTVLFSSIKTHILPEITSYIAASLALIDSIPSKLILVIKSGSQVVEKYSFEITRFGGVGQEPDRYFSAMVVKMARLDALLMPLPPGCSWNLFVEMDEKPMAGSDVYCVDLDSDDEISVPRGMLIPIKSMTWGGFRLQVVVEESRSKPGYEIA